MKVSDLTCGECYRCCTTNENKEFRTPLVHDDLARMSKNINSPFGKSSNTLFNVIQKDENGVYGIVIPKYVPAHTDKSQHGCFECTHLGGNGLCSLYEKRPFICKQYPFQFVKIEGKIMFSIVTNNCGLGQTIFEEICKGNKEIQDYAYKVYSESMKVMSVKDIESMADYAENNYAGFSIININLISNED